MLGSSGSHTVDLASTCRSPMTCHSNRLSIAVDPSKPGTSTSTFLFSLALNDASRSRSPPSSGARCEPSFRGCSLTIAFYPTHLPICLR